MSNVVTSPLGDHQPATMGSGFIGASAVALLGAAVLLDAAVETWWSGSSVCWWAIGAAALYLAVTALTWHRRIGWRERFGMVAVIGLGLLAVTAWRPGGLTGGVRLFGQPTPIVLSSATAATIVAAALVLMRATSIPLPARTVSVLLAIYALTAFVVGVRQATAYPALFAGASLWQAAPQWLQGAILGGVVVLPLALIVSLLGSLASGARAWRAQQATAFGLVLALTISGFMNAAGVELKRADLGDNVADKSRIVAPVLGPLDQRTVTDAVTVVKSVPSVPPSVLDVDGKAAEIGNDPAALFAFVRDNVRPEVYSGVLRGARGALMGRAGNAWDQSLLLAALLRHHGLEVRFARGRLSSEAATAVVSRMFQHQAPVLRAPAMQIPASLESVSRGVLARIESSSRSAEAEVVGALEGAGLPLGQTAPFPDQMLAAEAVDHLWVEYRDGGAWVALDSTAASKPGETVTIAGETFSEVPDSFYHHVTIRVQLEERRDQTLETKEVFRYPTSAAALNGAFVVLAHQIEHLISGQWRATPVLFVDRQAYSGMSFMAAGLTGIPDVKQDLVGQAHEVAGQTSQLKDLFGGGPSKATATDQLSAVWLEVEFVDPANRTEVVRREILDRIGLVARADGHAATAPLASMLLIGDIPVQLAGVYACAFTAGAIDPTLPLFRLSSHVEAIDAALASQSPTQFVAGRIGADEPKRGQVWDALPAILSATAATAHLLSQRLAARLRPSGVGSLVLYEATPRLAIASLGFDASPDGKSAIASLALDLRRNVMRVVGHGVSGRDLVRANLTRSLLDGAIEDSLAGQFVYGSDAQRVSTVAILEKVRSQRVELLATRDISAIGTLGLPEEARARMQGVVSDRLAIVAPARFLAGSDAARAAWWQVDLVTGEAVGVLDSGLHGGQAIPERGVAQQAVANPMARAITGPVARAWQAGFEAGYEKGVLVGGLVGVVFTAIGAAIAAFVIVALGK